MSIFIKLFYLFSDHRFFIPPFYEELRHLSETHGFLRGLVALIGFPTSSILILFFGSIQLMSAGWLGEYIGRIYDEAKHRPMYIIERAYNVDILNKRGF